MCEIKLSLSRVRLNRQGYDSRGHYYGNGMPLWFAQDLEGSYGRHFRARTREDAKEQVRAGVPFNPTFYR